MKKNLKSIDLHLIANLILSVIVLIMGIIIMAFKAFGLNDRILYTSILFYTYAFFSIIAYFAKRKEGDYELLLLSLINIIVATYMFVFQNDSLPMILGSGMTIYTILMIANRGYKVIMLKNQDNFNWVVKFIMTFLLAFIGILTTVNLFNETTVQTMMMGYYFITNGILMTLESGIELFVTERQFNKILSKIVDEEEEKLDEIKEEVIIAPIVKEKPKKKVVKKNETSNEQKKSNTTKDNKKSEVKQESKKVVAVKTEKKPTKKESKVVETKENVTTKKVGRPKKEAAIKESRKSEIKIVEKKKATPKTKKEVASTNSKPKTETKVKSTAKAKNVAASETKTKKEASTKKTATKKVAAKEKKETAKKTTTTKKVVKETAKKPGRPKKTSSK